MWHPLWHANPSHIYAHVGAHVDTQGTAAHGGGNKSQFAMAQAEGRRIATYRLWGQSMIGGVKAL